MIFKHTILQYRRKDTTFPQHPSFKIVPVFCENRSQGCLSQRIYVVFVNKWTQIDNKLNDDRNLNPNLNDNPKFPSG